MEDLGGAGEVGGLILPPPPPATAQKEPLKSPLRLGLKCKTDALFN